MGRLHECRVRLRHLPKQAHACSAIVTGLSAGRSTAEHRTLLWSSMTDRPATKTLAPVAAAMQYSAAGVLTFGGQGAACPQPAGPSQTYDLRAILSRVEEVALEQTWADWLVLHDADERRRVRSASVLRRLSDRASVRSRGIRFGPELGDSAQVVIAVG
jgi:hypothetical protein